LVNEFSKTINLGRTERSRRGLDPPRELRRNEWSAVTTTVEARKTRLRFARDRADFIDPLGDVLTTIADRDVIAPTWRMMVC
jgi:hypothetical protein